MICNVTDLAMMLLKIVQLHLLPQQVWLGGEPFTLHRNFTAVWWYLCK